MNIQKRYSQQHPMLVVTVIIGIGIAMSLQMASTASTANATNQSQTVNGTAVNNTSFPDPASEIAALTTAFGEPFYLLNDSQDTGREVLSVDPQQTKNSYISHGYMQDIGNVTEYGTYVTTYSSPVVSSDGKGMIVKGDQVATFTAKDTGSYDSDGNIFLKGSMFFQSDDKEMASINGKVGLYLYWKYSNGTDGTKTWLWE